MKKKFGFTLAEILITLGIIGVVAALTAPALVKNSGQAKVGPALAKFVNTFETAVEQMMTDENESSFSAGSIIPLANHMIMTPFSGTYTFTDAKGDEDSSNDLMNMDDEIQKAQDTYQNCINNPEPHRRCRIKPTLTKRTIWQLKDGSIMVFAPTYKIRQGLMASSDINYTEISGKGTYKGIVAEILYDIDGDRGNNRAGKDVFSFLVDKSGILIPSGSKAHKYITTNTENQKGSEFMKEYTDNCDITSSALVENLACTGKIADNGWKADY